MLHHICKAFIPDFLLTSWFIVPITTYGVLLFGKYKGTSDPSKCLYLDYTIPLMTLFAEKRVDIHVPSLYIGKQLHINSFFIFMFFPHQLFVFHLVIYLMACTAS